MAHRGAREFPNKSTPTSNVPSKRCNIHESNRRADSGAGMFPPSGTIDLKSLVSENQSIKLIPSVEEVVRNTGVTFDSKLDPETAEWLEKLRQMWNLWKKTAAVKVLLLEHFEQSPDPFTSVLKLILQFPSLWECKQNMLPYTIVEELYFWSEPRISELKYLLTTDLKFTAFNIAKEQKISAFLKLILDTYHLMEDAEQLLPHVKSLLQAHKYKAAQQVVLALRLQALVSVEELLVPLVFQDKLNLVYDYLATCPDQAKDLVKFLDNLLCRNESMKNKIGSFVSVHQIPDVKWGKLYQKPLGKYIARLCSTYNIPLKFSVNLTRHRAIGGIRFLIHQKYHQNVISGSAWADLVMDTVSDNPELVEELVNLVSEYDIKEALKWAVHFNLSKDLYPNCVKDFEETKGGVLDDLDDENWDSPGTSHNVHLIEYHPLSIPPWDVVFVDNAQLFQSVQRDLAGVSLIGIDSEWKPSFGTKPSCVSLIQIATKSNVYLFDVLALNDPRYTGLWTNLAETVFDNSNVTKIGFGLECDMREIRSSVPGLNCVKCKGMSYLELSKLFNALQSAGIKMSYQKQNVGEGLSSIVEQCFGKALKKHEQCSNWENRPLRDTQLEYAALDAYVLLEIHEDLKNKCIQFDVNFEDICYRVMSSSVQTKNKKPRKRHTKGKGHNSPGPNKHSIEPKNLKLLLQYELSILAIVLNHFGMDTKLCLKNETWEQNVLLASTNARYYVAMDNKHKSSSKILPNKNVFTLQSETLYEQAQEVITYFNVRILTPEDVYNTCQMVTSNHNKC